MRAAAIAVVCGALAGCIAPLAMTPMAMAPLMGIVQAGAAMANASGTSAGAGATIVDPPYTGMTKATAAARYGQPKTKTATPEGEVWKYSAGGFAGLGAKTRTLTFNSRGKVKEYEWQ